MAVTGSTMKTAKADMESMKMKITTLVALRQNQQMMDLKAWNV